jgi:hypothetical protein
MLVCVKNICASKKRLDSILNMINRIQKGDKVSYEESITVGNVGSALIDIYQGLTVLSRSRDSMLATMIRLFIKTFKNDITEFQRLHGDQNTKLVDYHDLITNVSKELDELLANNSLVYLSSYNVGASDNDYIIPQNSIANLINMATDKNANSEFNIVDLNASNGKADLEAIEAYPKANFYAISSYGYSPIRSDQRKLFKRFIIGGFRGAKVSNDCFDILVASPELEYEVPDSMNNSFYEPVEKLYLSRAMNYLRRGGLLIYRIRSEFLSKSLATYIAKHFSKIQVVRLRGEDENSTSDDTSVYILGTKKDLQDRGEVDPVAFSKLRNLTIHTELIDEDQKNFKRYTLPTGVEEVKRFRGSKLDDGEIESIYLESGAVKEFWKKQKVNKLSDKAAHPLLPFNVGQLGLVLTSGCLDGVIEEPDNCSHVVKGRVVKSNDSTREFNDDGSQVQINTTTSNRVEISMFLPDGTYKCLT